MKNVLALFVSVWFCSSCESREKIGHYSSGEVSYRAPLDATGRYDGLVKHFYKDGTLESIIPFHYHLVNGTAKGYYPTGKLKSLQEYKDGIFHGWYEIYYPDGHLKSTVRFNHGIKVDTLRIFYSNGELAQMIIYDSTGRKVDFGAWKTNGEEDIEYIRPLFLSDSDTIVQGQDYAFEIVLGNRRSSMVNVTFPVPIPDLDSLEVLSGKKRYFIRQPKLGQHKIDALINEKWRRKGSDTIWINNYNVEHKFVVLKSKPVKF